MLLAKTEDREKGKRVNNVILHLQDCVYTYTYVLSKNFLQCKYKYIIYNKINNWNGLQFLQASSDLHSGIAFSQETWGI